MQMDQENKERTAVKKHSPPIEKKKVCVCNENIGGCRMCGGKMYVHVRTFQYTCIRANLIWKTVSTVDGRYFRDKVRSLNSWKLGIFKHNTSCHKIIMYVCDLRSMYCF